MLRLVNFFRSAWGLGLAVADVVTSSRETDKFTVEHHKQDPCRAWVVWIIRCKLAWWKFIDKLRGKKPTLPPTAGDFEVMVGQAESHCVAKGMEEIAKFYGDKD